MEALDIIREDVAANGDEYCSFLLILMDCNMPIMDGYKATQEIREFIYSKGLPQPIISAVTGHSEPKYIKRAIKCGMN
jgi:CheY-like chemotaxis protein